MRKTNLLICLALVLICSTTFGQDASSARKLHEFGNVITDDKLAYLDLFASELQKDQSVRGLIVGRRTEGMSPGTLMRDIHGDRDYLINKRGILSNRIIAINAGIAQTRSTELWLLPAGVEPPVREVTKFDLTAPSEFDSIPMGRDEGKCLGEFFIHLYKLEDSVRFFGQALSQNPQAKGWIVIYPSGRDSVSSAQKITLDIVSSLTRDHGIAASRLLPHVAARRLNDCREVSLWLAPPDSTRADPKAHQAGIIDYAERNQYLVRRIEFIGNENTSDQILRRRLTINEGQTFTRSGLMQSLNQLSKAKEIHPVGLESVELHPDRNEKQMDIFIYFRERRRANIR